MGSIQCIVYHNRLGSRKRLTSRNGQASVILCLMCAKIIVFSRDISMWYRVCIGELVPEQGRHLYSPVDLYIKCVIVTESCP